MSVTAHEPSEYRDRDLIPVRRALLSVSDKTGLVEFASALADAGVALVATGSTAASIAAAGIPVTEVSEVTGFPESLDGRVKTLHPAIHGGLLADLRLEAHEAQLAELGIEPFQLLVVNLYPFEETVESGADARTVVENIDIGGPAMVRAGAKNYPSVCVVVDPHDYASILAAIRGGGTTLPQRFDLASKAFAHTAEYDQAVSGWFFEQQWERAAERAELDVDAIVADERAADEVPQLLIAADYARELRYGENSHQKASLYVTPGREGIAQAEQLHGKEMSFNNYVDADAAVRAAYDFGVPADGGQIAVAVIKHTNPCGIAVGASVAEAHRRAHACDPVSAYGGVIATNTTLTIEAAEQIAPIFTEVVIAPDFEPGAVEVLQTKKNLRILRLPAPGRHEWEVKEISGGLLVQQADRIDADGDDPANWTLAAGAPADAATLADLAFAWRACRSVKSNAILLARDGASVGVGMGQVNRVDSCRLAVDRAGDRAAGSVAASDAFFPFDDGPAILIDAGIRAIVQPGGSVRDADTIAAANAAGVTMYFTGTRHFFH